MTSRNLWLRAGCFVAATLLVALLGAWLLFGRSGSAIETDLLAMLPATERNPLAEVAAQRLAHANGDRVIVVIANADDDRAKAAARELGQLLAKDDVFASVTAELPPFDLQQLVTPYLAHRFTLLTDTDRQALSQPGYDPARALAQRINAPFDTGVGTRLQDDPFGWLQHWLDQQPWSRSPLLPEDNLLTAHRDDGTYVLITATLRGSSYDDVVQQRALSALDQAERTIEHDQPDTRVLRTGALFYAASARADAERDVHRVGLISTVGIALLLLMVFRSPGPLLYAFLSTAIGIVAATTVSVLMFGHIYLLTLVFGAALLGEAVDYSIQYLTARANAGDAWQPIKGLHQVRMALLLALGTSLLGYALLGLVPFSALRQMACFAMTGMTAACLSVFFLLPALLQRFAKPLSEPSVRIALALQGVASRLASGWRGVAIAALLLVASIPGWLQLGHDDDVHLLISPPATLMAQEKQIRDITGLGNATQFYLMQGADDEQVLQREEALEQRLQGLVDAGKLQGWLGLAGMVPSLQRQHVNQASLAPWFSQPDRMRQWLNATGFRDTDIERFMQAWPGTPLTLQVWLKTPLAAPFGYLWMGDSAQHGAASLVLPQGDVSSALLKQAADHLPGVTLVDKASSVSDLFGRYRRYASLWLLAAIMLIAPVFAWRYGLRSVPRVMAPPVLGMLFTLAVLGYLHHPLTLFHWMALMLVLGVGANYAVFLREGEPHVTHRPGAMYASVLLSAITALLSFGLLAWSSMPALREFGLTLLLGIGFTVLLVPASVASQTSMRLTSARSTRR
ncbi:MMPL family transporter [Dyella sp. 2HG41-7]|uniref:MMPL family transporter n=1 Tax=Dyella sp. 2HG41-7 TaxID=2883239 RepID=UPI001F48DE57|nr:MMPL family transporter [Dyella sp. 2HG41-7]